MTVDGPGRRIVVTYQAYQAYQACQEYQTYQATARLDVAKGGA